MTPAQSRTIYGWLAVLTLIVGGQLLAPLVKWDGKITIGWPSIVAPAAKVTAATYFFPNRGSVPPQIQAGISELNSQGIVATTHEEGTTNAAGQVPKQHEKSYPEALKAGLPCLVVIRSDGSLRVVKVTTKAEVLEACK